jgi:hypothetical protein
VFLASKEKTIHTQLIWSRNLHSTNVEHVYGLGLTLNHILVYGLKLTWFYTTIENSVKMCHFYFGGQGTKFQNVLGNRPIKVAHCKKI